MTTIRTALVGAAALVMSGCSLMPDSFALEDDELAIKQLAPIEEKFRPEILWRRSVGDGVEDHFSRLSPAVAYDKVYAASRHGVVKAFEQSTGKQLWSVNLADSDNGWFSGILSDGDSAKIAGGLTVVYGTVYLGTENGNVVALDAETGEVQWQTFVKGEVLARPAVESGIVVVNTGAGTLFALSAEDGSELWTAEAEVPPLSLRGVSAPLVANGGVIYGAPTGKLSVLILENGQAAWEQPIGKPSGATELERLVDIDSEPLILGGTIYVISYDGTLAAVELRSGRVVWNREYASYRRLALDGNTLFVSDNNGVLYALDRRNGVELWSKTNLKQRELTSVVPVGDYAVAGDKYGYLHWFAQNNGDIVARLAVGGNDQDEGIYVAPVVEGNILYAQTRDGQLVAVKTP
ncbi:outer membrane protein assembly factor BamB [Saliniradius amylolyticus]|nr:outer membrane protein assembly factor BamB [Saliniradius amylolyticus]